jgi:uncharacterized protein YhaN
MRLNSLDLARYGKFTDHLIDFGRPIPGQPDLHIVYGPNEAGKSTAFFAYLDLLFGIEPRSRFNFLHPYSAMRVGASVDTADGSRDFVRIKRPQRSLLDSNDRPIAESVILDELGGLDRDAYRTMFSLDDDTLEAGGESILASQGDLGQLLFSASTGLADLSRALIDLKAEADGFYKYRARNGELPELKARLAALKAEREQIDTFAAEYGQLVQGRDRAQAQYDEAIAERGRTQTRIEDIQRQLSALPRLAALRAIREKLDHLSVLPEPPPGWLEALPALQAEEIELRTRVESAGADIERITRELEAFVVNEAALRLAGSVDALAERRARFVTAEKDLPERRLQLQEQEQKIAGILGRLGRAHDPEPERLVLGASTVGALRDLIETRSGVEASVEAARKECAQAGERLEDGRARAEEAGGKTSGGRKRDAQIAALSTAVAALRGSDHAARLRLADRSFRRYRESLDDHMAALRPWAGNDDQLAELAIPEPGDLERWKQALAEANKQIDQHEAEIERLEAERRRVHAERYSITRVTGVVSEADAARVRAEREETWANHRRQLDDASAADFEAVLRRDDIVVNARLRHEAEITRLHQASAKLAVLEADLTTSSERLNAALASRQTVHDELAALLLTLTPRLPESFAALPRFEEWLQRREKALEVRAQLKQAEQDLREAKADIAAARETVSSALDALAVPHDAQMSFEDLLAEAQSAIDQELELKTLRAGLQDDERELKKRERALKKALEADDSWRASWAEACSGCWLGDGSSPPSVATVRESLVLLADLGPTIENRTSLAGRIGKMESDQALFGEEVAAIARALELDADHRDVLNLAHQITEKVQQASIAQAAKTARSEALDTAHARQRELTEALAIHGQRKAEMTAFFQAGSLSEVTVKLQDIAKRAELKRQAEEAERDILEALRLASIEEAEGALDAADRGALEAELAECKGRFKDQDQRTHDLFSSYRKADDLIEAVGGDNAAAMIEEKRKTVLLEIEEKALRYLRLRAGVVAAEQALYVYRDRHRSSMMARASSTFRAISRNAYRNLMTQLDKDSEILIAVAANGSSKVASELSKGARFQLYLALRVAGYYEFAQSRSTVPFIADDIMETFDEFRAEETFKVFAEMAQIGQVIYLTHHRHLCEIAQSICPGVRIHDLTAVSQRAEPRTSAA